MAAVLSHALRYLSVLWMIVLQMLLWMQVVQIIKENNRVLWRASKTLMHALASTICYCWWRCQPQPASPSIWLVAFYSFFLWSVNSALPLVR